MNKIRNYELFFIYISIIIGPGILTLPRRAAEGSGVDGIIAVFIAGIIFTFLAYIFSKLAVRFWTQTVLEFSESLIGKYLTRAVSLILAIYFIVVVSIQVRNTSSAVKQFLLFNTPLEIIIMTMLLVCAISVSYGIVSISRICFSYSILTISALLIILLLSLRYFNIENLYPIFSNSMGRILSTAFSLGYDYLGFEVLLFLTPLLVSAKDATKVTVSSMITITLLYILTTAISFGEFGLTPNQYIVYPVATLSKAVFITGFAERIDLLFMTFWILASFVSIIVIWFIASYSLSKIIPQKNYTVFVFLSFPVVYVLSLIPQNAAAVNMVTETIMYFAYIFLIPLFIAMYIIALIRKRGEQQSEKI